MNETKTKIVSWAELELGMELKSGSKVVFHERSGRGWWTTALERPNGQGRVCIDRLGTDRVEVAL